MDISGGEVGGKRDTSRKIRWEYVAYISKSFKVPVNTKIGIIEIGISYLATCINYLIPYTVFKT